MHRPLLVMFIGFPGSGKTYFAKQLAGKLEAITLNSDALRLAMFGSLEAIERIRASSHRSRLYDEVFGAMNYAASQALRAGHSVIYDAQMAKRKDRSNMEALAARSGALPVLVWMQTRPEVAIERGQSRAADTDSHQYTKEKMEMLVSRFDKSTELPESSEHVVIINGEIPFNEQYESFLDQLSGRLD